MVIININLVPRATNVTRVMITTTTTIVMVRKEEMELKFWMRYYLPLYLSESKADDNISIFSVLLSALFLYPLVYVKKLMGNPNSNHHQRGPLS